MVVAVPLFIVIKLISLSSEVNKLKKELYALQVNQRKISPSEQFHAQPEVCENKTPAPIVANEKQIDSKPTYKKTEKPLEKQAKKDIEKEKPDKSIVASTKQSDDVPVPKDDSIADSYFELKNQNPWTASDMEALIGGNIMSKVGAFVLIVGLAIFLSYSFASLGPEGKIVGALIFSMALLISGIYIEKIKSQNLTSAALIGAGWASMYITSFSAYAIEATKVIDSEYVGMLLVLFVATAMIIHSLKYKLETASGIAFILAFFGLFIGTLSYFTEIAAVIISISMLILSYTYKWHNMAFSAVILTYITAAFRIIFLSPGIEVEPIEQLLFIQPILLITWVLFETIHIIFLKHNPFNKEVSAYIFPLNAILYTIVSLILWPHNSEISYGILAIMISAQYVVSALIRGFWCQKPGEEAVSNQSYFLGSAEDCFCFALLSGLLIAWYYLPAAAVVIAWSIIGVAAIELSYHIPWQLMRFTGHMTMTFSFIRIFIANLTTTGHTGSISHRILTVTPVVLVMLYLYDRCKRELSFQAAPTGGTKAFSPAYIYFATILAAALIRFELGPALTAPAFAVCSAILASIGCKLDNTHMRIQAGLLAMAASGYVFSSDLSYHGSVRLLENEWVTGITASIALFGAYAIITKSKNETAYSKNYNEKETLAIIASATTAYVIYLGVSDAFLTLTWSLFGSALLISGFTFKEKILRYSGLTMIVTCIFKIFLVDIRVLEVPMQILAFVCLGGVMIFISWAYTNFKDKFRDFLE